MLSEPANFAGWSSYLKAGPRTTHKADFDFNFLPVGDVYFPPDGDDRVHASPQRFAALFDWWERIFDYTMVRREVRAHCSRHLSLLFEEARDVNPANPASLLRHMGADERHWSLDLTFSAEELSEMLLLDVCSGLCETAIRIDEAISAVQTFIRRARMGLEPGWHVSGGFAHLWDCRFISYRAWQACKRHEPYKENWIDWFELERILRSKRSASSMRN